MPTMSRKPSFPSKGPGNLGPLVPISVGDYNLLAAVAASKHLPPEMISKLFSYDPHHADQLLRSASGSAFVRFFSQQPPEFVSRFCIRRPVAKTEADPKLGVPKATKD